MKNPNPYPFLEHFQHTIHVGRVHKYNRIEIIYKFNMGVCCSTEEDKEGELKTKSLTTKNHTVKGQNAFDMQSVEFTDDTEKDIREFSSKLVYRIYKDLPKFVKENNKKSSTLREWRPVTDIGAEAKYEGEWDLETNERDGYGIQVWKDGSMYEGSFKQGRAHGKGRLIHPDGDVYEGKWKDDKA